MLLKHRNRKIGRNKDILISVYNYITLSHTSQPIPVTGRTMENQ